MRTSKTTPATIIPRRRRGGGAISVSWACTSGARSAFAGSVFVSATLLPSQISLVVLTGSQGAGQAELGHVVAIEADDVLIVSLGEGLLRLADGEVVVDAVGVALLRLAESLLG